MRKRIIDKGLFSDNEKILKMYSYDKISPREIAIKMNCCKTTIYNILKKHNVKILGTPFFNKGRIPNNKLILNNEKIINRYAKEKLSVDIISKQCGCSIGVIYRILRENKIKLLYGGKFKKGKIPKNKIFLDYKQILKIYKKSGNLRSTSKYFKCNTGAIRRILNENGIKLNDTKFKKGRIDPNKNKIYEEIYGEEKAKEIKEKNKLSSLGMESNKRGVSLEDYYGEERAKVIKKKLKKARAKQVFPVKDSSIEVKIQNFLKQLGIEFFTHQYMKIEHGYQCDVLIPSMNLVIECDGDYWHKYPIGNDLDHIRTNELIKKGFKVLRLWEFEINEMSIDGFEKRLHFEQKFRKRKF